MYPGSESFNSNTASWQVESKVSSSCPFLLVTSRSYAFPWLIVESFVPRFSMRTRFPFVFRLNIPPTTMITTTSFISHSVLFFPFIPFLSSLSFPRPIVLLSFLFERISLIDVPSLYLSRLFHFRTRSKRLRLCKPLLQHKRLT